MDQVSAMDNKSQSQWEMLGNSAEHASELAHLQAKRTEILSNSHRALAAGG